MSRPKSAFHRNQLEAYVDILNKLVIVLSDEKYIPYMLSSCDMLCEHYEITKFKVQFDKLNNQFIIIQNHEQKHNKNRPGYTD